MPPSGRSVGSSPLARGLPDWEGLTVAWDRIIPARAGFTLTPAPRGGPLGDHPRSRGVYAKASCATSPFNGSSPLARGLPPPASPETGGLQGSSPLARGLQPEVPALLGGHRIIPARAGFTRTSSKRGQRGADHPRSRGVYVLADVGDVTEGGSSPLARGLPARVRGWTVRQGIIPARAGFTLGTYQTRSRISDHPRSRGVYHRPSPTWLTPKGSSPLARGLRASAVMSSSSFRIIPARAGFTCRATTQGAGRRDHPRSRGVYNDSDREWMYVHGSSPLARGLL